ncbi:MAG: ABC transporter ATP-binding protein [Oligoflexus sp.]
MIDVRSISKFYRGKKAIDNLSFTIAEGETVGLLGLNGAGKSTVLKILGCFLVPSNGGAFIGGRSVTNDPQEVRSQIGFLPDTPPLYPEMTVTSYLRFAAQLKGVNKLETAKCVDQAIGKTNLQDVRDYRLAELSHGYRQRVGIAQAIVHKPRVLILDEPINGLDPIQIVEMRDLIVSLKGDHTVLLSSHILSEITKTCDRILVIDGGQLVAEGRENDLRNDVKQAHEVILEWENGNSTLIDRLKQCPGVQTISTQTDHEKVVCNVYCDRDVRAELAKLVVEDGAKLLALGKKEAELESLFLKLISKEHLNG